VRRQLWWLLPLTAIWLVGMWMLLLFFRTDQPVWAIVVLLVGNVITFGISCLIGLRRPDVRIGQLFALATAGFAVNPFAIEEIESLIPAWAFTPIVAIGAVMSGFALAAVCWVVLLFPDGRHFSPRWRWVSWYLAAFLAVQTPIAVYQVLALGLADSMGDLTFVAIMVPLVAALVALFVRYRSAERDVRAQIAWLLYAVGIYVAFLIVGSPFITGRTFVAAALDQVFYVLIPIAIGISVFRFRLYEIDRVVSRTVSYGLVVGVMVGVYAGVVSLIQLAVPLEEDLAVAISTLAAVAVSVPLVRRVRAWVDRRFFRSHYDSAAVVARVANDLRTTVDLGEVERRAGAVVDEVFAPEAVGIWLAGEAP